MLVGLDINPTFATGAYTGVTGYAARITGTLLATNILSTGNLTINGSSDATSYQHIISGSDGALVIGGLTGAKQTGFLTNTALTINPLNSDTTRILMRSKYTGFYSTIEQNDSYANPFNIFFRSSKMLSVYDFGSTVNIGGSTYTTIGVYNTGSARLQVRGNGSTSATTALRIEKSDTTVSLVVLDDGSVGIGTANPTANLHISGTNGANALRIEKNFTPTSTSDTAGTTGAVAWDDSYVYVKTSAGWKRSALSTF